MCVSVVNRGTNESTWREIAHTQVTGPNQGRRHGFFDNEACGRSVLAVCFRARLGDMRGLAAQAAADLLAGRILALELLVHLDGGVFGSKRAERAGFQVLDAGQAQNMLLLNALQSSPGFVVQKLLLLVEGEAGLAAVGGHAGQCVLGEADLVLGHAPGTAFTEPLLLVNS